MVVSILVVRDSRNRRNAIPQDPGRLGVGRLEDGARRVIPPSHFILPATGADMTALEATELGMNYQ